MLALKEWKDNIEISTWDFVTNFAVVQTFVVEYAWKPSRCSHCKVFGHADKVCLAVINEKDDAKEEEKIENIRKSNGKTAMDDEGYIEVTKKRGNGRNSASTSGVKDNGGSSYKQYNGGKYGNARSGNNYRGKGGIKGGNGQGKNRNWTNRSPSHWNQSKNQKFEATYNKEDMMYSQGQNGNRKDGQEKKVNGILENKAKGVFVKKSY